MSMPSLSSSRPRSIRPSWIQGGALLALGAFHFTPYGQPVETSPEAPAASGPGSAPRNGFAEQLRPAIPLAKSQRQSPYAPIKRQDNAASIPEIEVFVGESRVFPTPKVARIAVGNGQIMNAAALDKREVIVFANGVGTSSLFIWTDDGRYQRVKVNIVPGDTSRYAREIAAFLGSIPNARASVIGDKVIVEGDELSDNDIAKIDELAKRYPQIVNFTNRVGWEQMVIMDVKVVEFPTHELREIGLKWGAAGGIGTGAVWSPIARGDNSGYQIGAPGGAGSPTAPPITPADPSRILPSSLHVMSLLNLGLNAQLNLLAQNGTASVLAEPQLSARNGAKASFLAGGEYPYTVSTINGPTVMFKPYGVRLDIQPRVDRNGLIRATIDSEVSAIDPSVATTAGPAISSRKTNTEFNLRSGETLVLSGLLSRRSSTDTQKVPLLGDLPILGALFRSKRFQNDETELVVFVTPTVVDSRSAGLVDRVDQARERLTRDVGKPPFLAEPSGIGTGSAPVPAESASSPEPASAPSRVTGATATGAGPQGPAAAQAITANAPTPGAVLTPMQVTARRLAVRVAPDINAQVVAVLRAGDRVDALPQPQQAGWTAVQTPGGRGWVPAAWLVAVP